VVEVLSPSNSANDLFVKFNKYREAGVREYWAVNTDMKLVQKFVLQDNKYYAEVSHSGEIISVEVLPGCEIDLSLVFAEEEHP
jgi:Uma2 family endonuclease